MAFRFAGRRVLFAACALLTATPAASPAQDVEDDLTPAQENRPQFENRRSLNGHTFLPSRQIGQPFVAGYLRAQVGGAYASGLLVPIRDLEGNVLRVGTGELTALLLEAEYQQRFGNWLAVRVGGGGAARTGTNRVAVLSQGLEAQYGFSLGATVKLLRSDRVALSAVGDFQMNQVYAYNLYRWLRDTIDGGIGAGELPQTGTTKIYTGGLSFAWSPSKWWGFTVAADGGILDPFLASQGTTGVVSVGAAVDYDLGAGTKVPLGFQLLGKWDNTTAYSPDLADNRWESVLSIGYTGRVEFYAGLEIGYASLGIREDVPAAVDTSTLDIITLGLVIRYYF